MLRALGTGCWAHPNTFEYLITFLMCVWYVVGFNIYFISCFFFALFVFSLIGICEFSFFYFNFFHNWLLIIQNSKFGRCFVWMIFMISGILSMIIIEILAICHQSVTSKSISGGVSKHAICDVYCICDNCSHTKLVLVMLNKI